MAELFGETEPQAEPSDTGRSPLRKAFRGETVLVTGAAGSLGRALAARLAALPLEGLLPLDTNEQGLFRLKKDPLVDLREVAARPQAALPKRPQG